LADVVERFHPTVLVGASGQTGAFTEAIVRAMHRHCARPVVLPISNPTAKAEATPADLLRWTDGAAVFGAGGPLPPGHLRGPTYEIGQGNNAFIFPGVGLGAIAVDALRLTEGAFDAASRAICERTVIRGRAGEPIYPPLASLRSVSAHVAVAVGRALVSE